jgi:hypothetical protein
MPGDAPLVPHATGKKSATATTPVATPDASDKNRTVSGPFEAATLGGAIPPEVGGVRNVPLTPPSRTSNVSPVPAVWKAAYERATE